MELVLKKLAKKYGMEFHEETDTHLCYIDIALDKLVLTVVYYKKDNSFILCYCFCGKEYQNTFRDVNELEETIVRVLKTHKDYIIKRKLDRIEGDF
jgi:hypothetical protein